jgi:ABC-type transporter Mla maintaining outer membrane lipid asymmetry ATPase subunit MlaF
MNAVDAALSRPSREATPPVALDVIGLSGPMDSPVLHDVSLTVQRGGTHVVLGPMHSGKSLLLRLILGLERARHGTIRIGDVTFDAALPNEGELRDARRGAGVVFESSALVSRLTLLENVELPLVEHTAVNATAARDRAAEALREVGITGDIDRTPERISRLDRRRVALARALVLEPPLLLIDELGHGLDAHAAADLDDTLRALQERYGCASLICSQEVRYAFQSPDVVSVLAGGRIVEQGNLEQLRASRHAAVRRFIDRRGAA